MKVRVHLKLLLVWFALHSDLVSGASHYVVSSETAFPGYNVLNYTMDGPLIFASLHDALQNTKQLVTKNILTGQETVLLLDEDSGTNYNHLVINDGNAAWVEEFSGSERIIVGSSGNELDTLSYIRNVEMQGSRFLVTYRNTDLSFPASYAPDKLRIYNTDTETYEHLTDFYAVRGSEFPRYAFTSDGKYAYTEFNDKSWSTNSNPEKLVFYDGNTTTVFTYPQLNFESPMLIIDDSLLFVDEGHQRVARLQGGIIQVELPMTSDEKLGCLVQNGGTVLYGVNNPNDNTCSVYEKIQGGQPEFLLSENGYLEQIVPDGKGIYLAVSNPEKSLYYFQKGKGISYLTTLDYFTREIFACSGNVVFRIFLDLNHLLIDEIPLPDPGEYAADMAFDFVSNSVSIVSPVMQGKDLAVLGTLDLTGEWTEVASMRYLQDGVVTQQMLIADVLDKMAEGELDKDEATSQDKRSLFLRTQLRY